MKRIRIPNEVVDLFPELVREELIKGNEVIITIDGKDYLILPAIKNSTETE